MKRCNFVISKRDETKCSKFTMIPFKKSLCFLVTEFPKKNKYQQFYQTTKKLPIGNFFNKPVYKKTQ